MKNWILNHANLIKSLKFRIFIIVTLAIIVPGIISGTFIVNLVTKQFLDEKIEIFNANNNLLRNNISNSLYMSQGESEIVDTQIAMLANEYKCRIEIINTKNTIINDTESSEIGKTSISQNVFKASKGESVFVRNDKEQYVEFSIPIVSSLPDGDGNTVENIIGVLYINYSISNVFEYKEMVKEYIDIIMMLIIIFALFMAWLCSLIFTRPIKRIEQTVDGIYKGNLKEHEEKRDYTEIEQITHEFNKMVNRLNKQEKSRQEFVSNVSHELKTPITSMKVLADSLTGQQGVPEELYQEFLQDISKEIDRENEIIMDLLELVRTEKSETEINISSVNINELVESVLKRLKPIAKEKNIELIFESFRPVIAEVDELKFGSVVTNLVENAIKYNVADGTVTASLNSDHQYFYLKVADTGIGISEEDQERVFERFFRVDKARARETGGTGLGLAISYEIVKKHHGLIKIHSKEEEGTIFTVRIPLKYIR